MKSFNFHKKIAILLISLFCLGGCKFTFPNLQFPNNGSNTGNNTPNNDVNLTIGEKIKAEHKALKDNTQAKANTWRFTGAVVDMCETKFNNEEACYDIRLVISVDDVLIAVYDGLNFTGEKPNDIEGLEIGTNVTVTGKIDFESVFVCNDYNVEIQFTNPKVSWPYKTPGDNSGNTGGDSGNTGGDSDNTDTTFNPAGDISDKTSAGKVYFGMINDTHGAFTDSNDGKSIARVDTLYDGLEAQNGRYIKIANGDMLQGSYTSSKTYGLTMIEALNEMDFDAFVIGNHEFDWGIEKIAVYKDGILDNGEADFPFLGANIVMKSTNSRPSWIDPYTIVDYGDVKVGIIGLLGGTQESDISAQFMTNYEFIDDPSNLIKNYAIELRTEKECDIVVLATHDYDDEDFTAVNYVKNTLSYTGTARIDAIFAAHVHWRVNTTYNRADGIYIPVVQNKGKNQTAQEVVLNYNKSKTMISSSSTYYNVGNYSESDDLDGVFDKYSSLIADSNEVLGTAPSALSKPVIGNLVVETMAKFDYKNPSYNNISLAIINTSGIRATIPFGDITYASIYNALTFENEIILIKIKGKYINSLNLSSYYYTYKTVSSFLSETVYEVAVIDYVYYGQYLTGLKNNKTEECFSGYVMRDPFIEYVINNYN